MCDFSCIKFSAGSGYVRCIESLCVSNEAQLIILIILWKGHSYIRIIVLLSAFSDLSSSKLYMKASVSRNKGNSDLCDEVKVVGKNKAHDFALDWDLGITF